MKDHFKRRWRDYLLVIFFVLFIILICYFYINLETLKHNPCELCVESYDLTCNDGKGLVLYKGYDWDGSESIKELQAKMNAEQQEMFKGLENLNLSNIII